ncbi:molybdopterin oxidoreductase family protein [Cytobacillus sp. NCCP-133]|uniref:molybdopterin oxidoreductase family protein n=1 Tax=Cytobacillus sp. NCCP-133 TaxID=766848 RepID=UPI00222E2397|nr:molybdopterin-dependent oxidoreductase [Cytobacillus sp. NCCP-133]GLB60757.1 hypothetical protein NCCP133_28890 [Cytobacillus sp. NCCP-133]
MQQSKSNQYAVIAVTLDDFDQAEVLLLMGSNTTEAHPIIANRMKKAAKNGLKIIIADPRKIDMVKVAHRHLQINIGSDIALINALIHTIIKEGHYDAEFIKANTIDFESLKQLVSQYTPEKAAEITGLLPEEIIETAREYASASNSMIAYTLGITEHHCGVNNVFNIANLALLTGHIGKKGNGIMPLRGQNNVQGAGDMGCLPNLLPGSVSITDETVVQDIFLTETAKLADVVLPARSWGESDGTYTNTDRRIQRARIAVESRPNVKEDWEILCELSAKMGYSMNYAKSEEIWDEVRKLAWEMYGGISYSRLENGYAIHYPCPDENHPGTHILHQHLHEHKSVQSRKSPFVPVGYTPPIELPDKDYPFTLTTGRRYETYNTHTQTRLYAEGVKIKQIEETLDVHPADAALLGIKNGETVQVSSRRGSLEVKVKITEQVVPGLVFMSFHWYEVPTNVLTINEYDPISGTAEFKACAVKIVPIDKQD